LFWKRKKDKKASLPFSLEYDEDQRSYYRVAPRGDEPLFLQTKGKRYSIIDVSAGGIAFEGAGFGPGDALSGVLTMPKEEAPIPIVLSVIQVLKDKMIAAQFRKIKDEDRERVHQYVLQRQKEELDKKRRERLTEAKHQAGPPKSGEE
jgi:c-di-GMP-binding flagellar brake protein YcgR